MSKKIKFTMLTICLICFSIFLGITYIEYSRNNDVKTRRVEDYFEQVETYYEQVSETYLSTDANNLKHKSLFKKIYEEKPKHKDYLNRYKRCQKLNLILTYNLLTTESDLDYKFFLSTNNNLNMKMRGLKTNLLFSNNRSLLNKSGKIELPDELMKIIVVTRKDCEYCIDLKNNFRLANLDFKVYSFDNPEDSDMIKRIEGEYGNIVLVPFVLVNDNNMRYGEEQEFKRRLIKEIITKLNEIEGESISDGKNN